MGGRDSEGEVVATPRVYRRRWLILTLFALFSVCNAIQWIQFSIIQSVLSEYYGVSNITINWTSLVYMVSSAILIFPATWLLNYKGLRKVIVLGQSLNTIGGLIKLGSADPDRFWVAMIGQTIVATAQVYVMSSPAAVAAAWFPPSQVATATGVGFFGLMIGNGLGSLIPPLIVTGGSTEEVTRQLYTMFAIIAAFATILLVLIVIFMKEAPPTPPSAAQAMRPQELTRVKDFLRVLLSLVRDYNFLKHMLAYGISVGVFSAIMTYLNPIIEEKYPENGAEHAGYLGATFVGAGLIGTVVCGIILDYSRKFKTVCLVLYSVMMFGFVGMTLLLVFVDHIAPLYCIAAIIGFMMIGYLPAGYELGMELTYPTSEATTSSLLSFFTFFSSFIFSLVYGLIYKASPDSGPSNGAMCAALVVGTASTFLIVPDLKRQAALAQAKIVKEVVETKRY